VLQNLRSPNRNVTKENNQNERMI